MRLVTAVVLTTVSIASPALAASKPRASGSQNFRSLLSVKGKCERLLIYGNDRTDQCKSSVINTEYKDGEPVFIS